ncbi:MAG: cupredoxin domain-containing protein [Bauldia sp.]
MFRPAFAVAFAMLAASAGSATAFEIVSAGIALKDHRFDPQELQVPAGKRILLKVDNQDATPEEFESHELKVEKVIPGGSTGTVRFGPLDPGRYPFFGEFNESTAQGVVVAE